MNNYHLNRTWGIATSFRPIIKLLSSSVSLLIDVYYRDIVKANASASSNSLRIKTPYNKEANKRILHDRIFINGINSSYSSTSSSYNENELELNDFEIFSSNNNNYVYPGNLYKLIKYNNEILFSTSIPDEDACFDIHDITSISGVHNNGETTLFEYLSENNRALGNIAYESKDAVYWDCNINEKNYSWNVPTIDTNKNFVIRFVYNINYVYRTNIIIQLAGGGRFINDFINLEFNTGAAYINSAINSIAKIYKYNNPDGTRTIDIVYGNMQYTVSQIGINKNILGQNIDVEFITEEYDSSEKDEIKINNIFYKNITNENYNNIDYLLTIDNLNNIRKIDKREIRQSTLNNNCYVAGNLQSGQVIKVTASGNYTATTSFCNLSTYSSSIFFVVNTFNNNNYLEVYFNIISCNNINDINNLNIYKYNNDIYIAYNGGNSTNINVFSNHNIDLIGVNTFTTDILPTAQKIEISYNKIEKTFGSTSSRPSNNLYKGFQHFDTTLNKPIWWNGTEWVDSEGNDADSPISGSFADRPTGVKVGYSYFCTDKQTTEGSTNGIMIYYKGSNTWVDALGRVVS